MRNPLAYLSVFSLPLSVALAFILKGWWSFFPIVYAFGIVPFIELWLTKDTTNASEEEEKELLGNKGFDLVIYLVLPVQLFFVGWFAWIIMQQQLAIVELVGLIFSMGILCGAMAINVAHELGHRQTLWEQAMAKALLLTSFYMHFFIEHNRGHHNKVATPEDPSSARLNEMVYTFWFRSVIMAYRSAWKLEFDRLAIIQKPKWSLHNEMLRFQLIQLGYFLLFWFIGGWKLAVAVLLSGIVGFILLETVNYIEHYGLQREKKNERRYERVRPVHSWNSNHPVGRLLLFELSRHSDHHFKSDRKYQILRHHDDSLQMPTGYPGMMILSLVPPLFFKVVNPLIQR